MSDNDTLQKFLFEHTPIRGEIVHLDATWNAVLEKHEYPPLIRNMLGEMMAAAVLLAATLKLNGRLIIQLQGSGPVTMMVVECSDAAELRGVAHWDGLPEQGDLKTLVGDGCLTITLEPADDQQRYQSIVEITGNSLSDALMNYLQQSEQLDTHLWLAAGQQRAAGILLQRLPEHPDRETLNTDADAWNRVVQLTSTVSADELLKTGELDLLYRLFHEETVRIFEPSPVYFRCTCSSERVSGMLRSLGQAELHDIIAEQGHVAVACEFCNQKYTFDSVDIEQLFASNVSIPGSDVHH